MIKIVHHQPGRYAPLLFCDICGKRIEDASTAAVLSISHPIQEGGASDVMHVHKGDCHDAADRRIGKKLGFDELSRHMLHLVCNIGLPPEKLEAHQKAESDLFDVLEGDGSSVEV